VVIGRRKQDNMLGKIPCKKVFVSSLQPVLPLVPEVVAMSEENKSSFITMELKTRKDGPAKSMYKKYIKRFEDGSPQEWIDLLRDLEEVWHQNSILNGND